MFTSELSAWNPVSGFKRALSIDYRTLALVRVCLAALIIADVLLRSRDFTAFFTDAGIIHRTIAQRWFGVDSWSLYFINGSGVFSVFLVLLSLLSAICLLIGYRTRLATIISWILLVSLHHRISIISSGADDLIRLLMFWSMFLPMGARFSVDRALQKIPENSAESHFSIATIAILMQAMFVYWVGALLKTGDAWMTDFSAVYYALNAEHYATHAGVWVQEHMRVLLPYLTKFVYHVELYGPLAMLAPVALLWFRIPIMLLLICMHIGFLILLSVGLFPLVSITSLLLFTPPEFWRWLKSAWVTQRSSDLSIYYDKDCDFCLKIVRLIVIFFVLPHARVAAAQDYSKPSQLLAKHDSWVVQTPSGEYLLEWRALRYLIGRSPFFFTLTWPLALLSDSGAGKRAYHWIGDRRRALSGVTKVLLPWHGNVLEKKLPAAVQLLVGVVFVFVLYVNLQPVAKGMLPAQTSQTNHIKFGLGLWQKWNMFAPYPVTWTQWPVFTGITSNGKQFDMFRQTSGSPPQTKPELVLSEYNNNRWRKYHGRIYLKKFYYLRQPYVNFMCKDWNKKQTEPTDKIARINLKMANERTLTVSSTEAVQVVDLGVFECPE